MRINIKYILCVWVLIMCRTCFTIVAHFFTLRAGVNLCGSLIIFISLKSLSDLTSTLFESLLSCCGGLYF